MIDVYKVHATAKCGWIRRLYDDSASKWKTTFIKLLNIDINKLNKNLDYSMINICKSEFHKQTLSAWTKVYCTEPTNINETVNQFIIYNKSIIINRKPLTPNFFKSNDEKNILNIKILNMLNPQNTFLDVQEFNNNNTNISILEYNALKSCILGSWKKIFIHKNNVAQNQP